MFVVFGLFVTVAAFTYDVFETQDVQDVLTIGATCATNNVACTDGMSGTSGDFCVNGQCLGCTSATGGLSGGDQCDDGASGSTIDFCLETGECQGCFDATAIQCPQNPPPANQQAWKLNHDGSNGLCAYMSVSVGAPNVFTIHDWDIVGTVSDVDQPTLDGFVGKFRRVSSNPERLVCNQGACADKEILIFRSSDSECSIHLIDPNRRKRAPIVIVGGGALPLPLASAATADPHFVGANGVKYDFKGKPHANYTLFSSPEFELTMQLSASGPEVRYMTRIGLLFAHEAVEFDAKGTFTAPFVASLDAKLKQIGGRALALSEHKLDIELCPGHAVTLTKVRLVNSHRVSLYYLNVEVMAPGCHDSYDGALGQTYKCKYAHGAHFKFSQSQEEKFRVATLTTPSGSFSADAGCRDEDTFGPAPLAGGSK